MRILWVPWVVLTTRNERNTLGLERFLALSLKYNNDLEKLTFTKSQTVGWEREIVDYREKKTMEKPLIYLQYFVIVIGGKYF